MIELSDHYAFVISCINGIFAAVLIDVPVHILACSIMIGAERDNGAPGWCYA